MAIDKLKMGVDKLKMAFSVTNAADFTSGDGQVVISDIILRGQEFSNPFIGTQTGVKFKEKLIDISAGDTYVQETSGDVGALVYTGGTALADVEVSVVELAIKEGYVPNQLNSKLAGQLLAAGSDTSNALPLKDIVQGLKGDKVSEINSYQLWQGNVSGSTLNQTAFNGWLTQLGETSDPISGGTATALTAANALSTMVAFENIVKANFPAWITAGYAVFMSPANFQTFYAAKFGTNGVIDSLTLNTGKPVTEFTFGSTSYYSVVGLTGVNNLIATRKGVLVAVTDLVSETDTVMFEYLPEAQKFRLEILYKLGAKVARPTEVVYTK